MQVKKDYTHNLIVTVARQVFLKKGYVKASMRDIAKGAGIGVSNLYNYFKGKDELFRYVVMPLINEMERMMRNHHSVKEQEQFLHYVIDDVGDCNELMATQVREYMKLIHNYRDELKLILYKAQGSSLETFIDDYTDACTQQVLAFMNELKNHYPSRVVTHPSFTYHVHTVWMFSFISEVIKHQLSASETKHAIEDYIWFEIIGWSALMNHH